MDSRYKPLNLARQDIRLLKLHSSLFNDSAIRCSLICVSLNDKPAYTALSYVWGDPEDRLRILLDDQEFLVTRNLYSALQQLRPTFLDTVLWVDAICINQRDVAERNAQVPRMKDIYAAAKSTTVWLGPKSPTVEKVFHYFEDLWSVSSKYDGRADYPDVCFQERPDLINQNSCDLMISFFNHEWWKRVWTYQECVLSNEIEFVCGNKSLEWYTFEFAWQPLRIVGNDLSYGTEWMNWGSAFSWDGEVDQLQSIGGALVGRGKGIEILDEKQAIRVRELMEVAPHLHIYQRGARLMEKMWEVAGVHKSEFQPPPTMFLRFIKLMSWMDGPVPEGPVNLEADLDLPDRLKRFHKWMRFDAPFDSEYRRKSETYINMHIESHAIGIERLVLSGFERKCFDPRDKVYGLLGADTAKYVKLTADYSRPVSYVYADLIRNIAVQKKELRLLTIAGLAKRVRDDLPSWVPDFSQSANVVHFDKMRYDSDFVNRMPSAAALFSADLKSMTTPAVLVTRVLSLSGILSVENDIELANFLAPLEVFLKSNYHPKGSALPWRQVLFRTIIADDTDLIFPDSDEIRLFQMRAISFITYMASATIRRKARTQVTEEGKLMTESEDRGTSNSYLLNRFAWWMNPTPGTRVDRSTFTQNFLGWNTWASEHWDFKQDPEKIEISSLIELERKITATTSGSQLFATDDGYLGIAAAKIRPKDIIVAIPGSYMLLILREKGPEYELVSDTYICGRSASELWQEHIDGFRQIKEITLV